jgi:hypothetical protein
MLSYHVVALDGVCYSMALIPMRQTIKVARPQLNTDGTVKIDDWGNPLIGKPVELKCRIDEGSTLSKVRSQGVNKGEDVVADAKILLDKLADIRYGDTISFTNELGETIERRPKEINVKRGVSGKPMLTEVLI